MNTMNTLFGKPFDYWLELERIVENKLIAEAVIRENIALRAKVQYFEDQTKKAASFINACRDIS